MAWRCLVLVVLWQGFVGPAAAENWPEFRGPRGDGTSRSRGLPVRWSERENVVWKRPIHDKGWSSPVVWDDEIWLTTATEDGKQLFAVAVDLATGKILHDVRVFEIEKPQYCIERNSYASSTPAVDDKRVYVHYGAHGTAALDRASGKILWSRQDLPCYHHRGPASSPVLASGLLILTFDGYDQQYLVALDPATGETVWKRERQFQYDTDNGDIKKAYATPQVIEIDGQQQLIAPSAGAVAAYEPKTGKELWRVRSGGMNASARPVYQDGVLFLSTADGGFRLFAMRPPAKPGEVPASQVLWKQTKGVPKHSSPAVVGPHVYVGAETGVISCLSAKDGTVLWQNRSGESFTASPLFADGRIYFFSEDGQCPVLAPGEQFERLANNQLDDGFMASPAIAGKSLILRSRRYLYRIEESTEGRRGATP